MYIMRDYQKGGTELKAIDNQLYAYEYGGSPSENSFLRLQNEAAKQAAMSKQFSGGRHENIQYKRHWRRGGSADKITIPTFPGGGSSVSPFGADLTSLNANKTLITSLNDSSYDCFATNSCASRGGKKYKITKNKRHNISRRTKRNRRTRRARSKINSIKRKKRQY